MARLPFKLQPGRGILRHLMGQGGCAAAAAAVVLRPFFAGGGAAAAVTACATSSALRSSSATSSRLPRRVASVRALRAACRSWYGWQSPLGSLPPAGSKRQRLAAWNEIGHWIWPLESIARCAFPRNPLANRSA